MDVQSVRDQLSAGPKVIMAVSEWASDIYRVTTPECLLPVRHKAGDGASERDGRVGNGLRGFVCFTLDVLIISHSSCYSNTFHDEHMFLLYRSELK